MAYKDDVQAIKARLNIVELVRRYVELRRNGPRWVAPCPFHQETKPSFSVNEEDGFFYCFGCQASGDIFDFYAKINGLDFRETIEQLAEETGVVLQRTKEPREQREYGAVHAKVSHKRQLMQLHEHAAAHYVNNLEGKDGTECRAYLQQRGLSDEVIKHFGLGWSVRRWQDLVETLQKARLPIETALEAALVGRSQQGKLYDRFRGRLMFPIRSLSGSVIAFGGRIIADEEEAKYINSSDSPIYKKGEHLYGLQQARRAIAAGTPAMLTEGYMDVLTLHQFGYAGAMAGLGTALTPEQVKRIGGFTSAVELLYDGDAPGRKAALRACEMFLMRGMRCTVVLFPEGEDIDSLLRTQGIAAFEDLRKNAPEGLAFCLRMVAETSPREAVDWARNFLGQVEQPELLSSFASTLAGGLGLSEIELREGVAQRRSNMALPQQGAVSAPKRDIPTQKGQACDREVMTFAVRYPEAFTAVQHLGAAVYLREPWSRQLWQKMEQWASDEVFYHLDEREKHFWIRCRSGDVPPLNNQEGELAALRGMLDNLRLLEQSASVSAALRQGFGNGNFEADLEYLRALQETLEKTHGE